jgi:hypothetical protein
MRSNLLQQVKSDIAVAVQTITLSSGAATVKGAAIKRVDTADVLGMLSSAVVHIQLGVSGAAAFAVTPTIETSDTTTDGDFTAVTLNTAIPAISSSTTVPGSASFYVKTGALKKYWRVVLTAAGTTSDTALVAASVVQGDGNVGWLPRGTTPPTVHAKA